LLCRPADSAAADVYRLLVGAIVPRPIAWVTTADAGGVVNLAPFSFFTVASRDPAMLAISIGRTELEGKVAKDTLTNIRDNRQLVVNIASETHARELEISSLDWPTSVSEIERAGLTSRPSERVDVPRVAEAPIAFECRLEQEVVLGRDTLVIARVELIVVDDGVLDERGRISLAGLKPLGRMSGPRFCMDLAARTVAAPSVDLDSVVGS
jgi:flavin reductase (DIM6/NTAB) family NADH-FMN oxidoreductase RutF